MAASTSTLLWRSGALFTAAGIVGGSFGAHALRSRSGITPESLHAWDTASYFAMFNGLSMLVVSEHRRLSRHRFAGPGIAIGALIFSGTIWALVLDRERFRYFGPVTPLGGALMIAGYISLAL